MQKRQYIGVDLHRDNFVACFLQNEKVKKSEKYPISSEGFQSFRKEISKRDYVAVESTNNTSYFFDQVNSYVERITVVAPGEFAVIAQSTKKTDLNDAHKLAYFLYKDMLPKARIRKFSSQQLSSLISTRALFVKSRMVYNHKTRTILNRFGRDLYPSTLIYNNSYDKYVLCYEWEESVEFELRKIAEEVKNLNEEIKSFDQEILEASKNYYGYKNLMSISGIGPLTAAILLSIIDDINDFSNHKQLAAFFGIVPKIRHSNKSMKKGPITKRGSRSARTALIMATWQAIRYNQHLGTYYKRLKKQKDSKAATLATARKYLKIIYYTLKNDWIFDDFSNYKYHVRGEQD